MLLNLHKLDNIAAHQQYNHIILATQQPFNAHNYCNPYTKPIVNPTILNFTQITIVINLDYRFFDGLLTFSFIQRVKVNQAIPISHQLIKDNYFWNLDVILFYSFMMDGNYGLPIRKYHESIKTWQWQKGGRCADAAIFVVNKLTCSLSTGK